MTEIHKPRQHAYRSSISCMFRPSSADRCALRPIWPLVMTAFMILAPIGCSRPDQRPDNEIVFWHAMGGRLGQALTDIVSDFNRNNPDITVKTEYMGSYSSLRQKIIASLAAGNYPDLAQSFETWTSKFVEADKIMPVSAFLDESDSLSRTWIDDIVPVLRQANTYKGDLWAMPFNKSVPVMYYNLDLLREKGLGPPADNWTWDDFIDYAHLLTDDHDQDGRIDRYGYANTLTEWLFQCLIHQNGGSEFDPTETRITFAEPPGLKALAFILRLIEPERVAYYSTGFNNQNDFAAGKVALISSSCASRIYLEPVLQFDWSTAPLPRGQQPAVTVSGTNILIFKQANQNRLKGAWRFVRYFISPDVTLRWSLLTGYLPVRQSAIDSPHMQRALAQNPRIKASLVQLPYAVPSPKHQAWAKGRELLIEALEQSMIGHVPPEESLTSAARKAQTLLDRYNKN
ncbi:ABC transporter substrate-binding protein [bacterium]|nr:ABC transporter substrate-binding protein [bacterium]